MKNSAGVKFNDNTDLIIEADPSGEVTSCFNRSNDTEYVGGGGGESDFSIFKVSIQGHDILGACILHLEGFDEGSTSEGFETEGIIELIGYKGVAYIKTLDPPTSVEGNIEVISLEEYVYKVTGDCQINYDPPT